MFLGFLNSQTRVIDVIIYFTLFTLLKVWVVFTVATIIGLSATTPEPEGLVPGSTVEQVQR